MKTTACTNIIIETLHNIRLYFSSQTEIIKKILVIFISGNFWIKKVSFGKEELIAMLKRN